MPIPTSVDIALLKQWHEKKLSVGQIQERLSSMGYDDSSSKQHLDTFKKLSYEKRRWNGFLCMGVGAFLGFISCVLSLTNPFPEMYYVVLYGMTSLSILIIFLGLYFVFE